MTTLSTPGIPRPPRPGTISSGCEKPPTRTGSQVIQQTPRFISQQIFIDQNVGPKVTKDLSRPVVKRRKVDTDQRAGDQPPGGVPYEGGPGAFEQQVVPATSEPVKLKPQTEASFAAPEEDEIIKTAFPVRLRRVQYSKRNVSSTTTKIVRKEEVSDKPYNLEIPTIAPQYGNHGRSPGGG